MGANLHLELTTELGIIHVMLIFEACRVEELPRSLRTAARFQKKWQWDQACAISEALQRGPVELMYEALSLKPKLQWRLQNIGDTRNTDILLRRAIGTEWVKPVQEKGQRCQRWQGHRGRAQIHWGTLMPPKSPKAKHAAMDLVFTLLGFGFTLDNLSSLSSTLHWSM